MFSYCNQFPKYFGMTLLLLCDENSPATWTLAVYSILPGKSSSHHVKKKVNKMHMNTVHGFQCTIKGCDLWWWRKLELENSNEKIYKIHNYTQIKKHGQATLWRLSIHNNILSYHLIPKVGYWFLFAFVNFKKISKSKAARRHFSTSVVVILKH